MWICILPKENSPEFKNIKLARSVYINNAISDRFEVTLDREQRYILQDKGTNTELDFQNEADIINYLCDLHGEKLTYPEFYDS